MTNEVWPPSAIEPTRGAESQYLIQPQTLQLLRRVAVGIYLVYGLIAVVWSLSSAVDLTYLVHSSYAAYHPVRTLHMWVDLLVTRLQFVGIACATVWFFAVLSNVEASRPNGSQSSAATRAILLAVPYLRLFAMYPIMSGLWRDSAAQSQSEGGSSPRRIGAVVGILLVFSLLTEVHYWTDYYLSSLVPRSEIYIAASVMGVTYCVVQLPVVVAAIAYFNNVTNSQLNWRTPENSQGLHFPSISL